MISPHYNEKSAERILSKYQKVDSLHHKYLINLGTYLAPMLKNDKAREYLLHGVSRRIGTLTRCVHNVFELFPLTTEVPLEKNDLSDLDINLHAFFVNISGLLDNLAWVIVADQDLLGKKKNGKVNRLNVGLLKTETQLHMRPCIKAVVQSTTFTNWHEEYCKDYRDSLVHRIPLYVPPYVVNKAKKEEYLTLRRKLEDYSIFDQHEDIRTQMARLGKACPIFAHSLNESRPIRIHTQMLEDLTSLEVIIDEFCKDWNPEGSLYKHGKVMS